METSVKYIEPLAYTVSLDFTSFNNDHLELAFKNNDNDEINRWCQFYTVENFLAFISIKSNHAAVFLVPYAGSRLPDGLQPLFGIEIVNIADKAICSVVELKFESRRDRKYHIAKNENHFAALKSRLGKTYFIGLYKNINSAHIQLAAMRSAPTKYRIFDRDCLRFTQDFCSNLVEYSDHGPEMMSSIDTILYRISTTGFFLEPLSRRSPPLAFTGNGTLAAPDITTYLGNKYLLVAAIFFFIFFLFIYPFFIVVLLRYLAII